MSSAPFHAERQAQTALQKLYDDAERVEQQFQALGMPIPPGLARLIGSDDDPGNHAQAAIGLPNRPAGVEFDWAWVPTRDLIATTLVRAVLRVQLDPIKPKRVVDLVQRINPEIGKGTIYNVGPRLEYAGIIEREGGWKLTAPDNAPVLNGEFAWAPTDVFNKQELAAHRRVLIERLLSGDRLMVMQIVKKLEADTNCKAPVTKDLVKVDIQKLQKSGLIKRVGNTRQWTRRRQMKNPDTD